MLTVTAAQQAARWSLEQLWVHYLALGGTASIFDVEADLADLIQLPAGQRNVVICALNERLADLGYPGRVRYLHRQPTQITQTEPVDVLDELLRATRPPRRPDSGTS